MKKILIPFLLTLVAFQTAAQIRFPGQEPFLKIEVTLNDQLLNMDTLCTGYDEETGVPLNLIVPSGGQIVFIPLSDQTNYSSQFSSNTMIINDSDFGLENIRSFGFGSPDGKIDTVSFSNKLTSQNILFTWKTDYKRPQLAQLIELSQEERSSSLILRLLLKLPELDTLITSWKEKPHINVVNKNGLPINPLLLYNENNLVFYPSKISKGMEIQLLDHSKPFILGEHDGLKPFIFKNLPPGKYQFIMRAYADAPEKYTYRYDFTIDSPWWLKTYFIVIFVVSQLLIAFIIYLLWQRAVRKKKEIRLAFEKSLSDSELKAIRAQLNPHFLFNALNALQNLIEKKENESASKYLTLFSKMMRNVLNESSDTFHDLTGEIESVKMYLELEKLRFPFTYHIDIDQEVSGNTLVPTMLLQPFAENAIIHGIGDRKDGHIHIRVFQSRQLLTFEIIDNGKGLQSNSNQNSKGIALSQERMSYLEKLYGNDCTCSIKNRMDTQGVIVQISIPYNA